MQQTSFCGEERDSSLSLSEVLPCKGYWAEAVEALTTNSTRHAVSQTVKQAEN